MNRLKKFVFVIIFMLSQLVCAGAIASLSEGRTAYENGEITKALDILQPIANEEGLLSYFNSREDVAEASLLLSRIYIDGSATYFDFSAGQRYLDKSIEFGSVGAIEFYADLILNRHDLVSFDFEALQSLINQGKARESQLAVYFEEVLKVRGFYKTESILPDCTLLQKLYESGITRALDSLALCAFNDGKSNEAISLLERAVELNVPMAELSLGRVYLIGMGVKQNMPRAMALFENGIKKTPENSPGRGQYHSHMGLIHCLPEKWSGMTQNEARGRTLLEKAAEMGAGLYYSRYTYTGFCGFPVDKDKALEVIAKIEEVRPVSEIFKIGLILNDILYNKGPKEQLVELTSALESWSRRDSSAAFYRLGMIHETGMDGIENINKALENYESCIELNKIDTKCLSQAGQILLGRYGAEHVIEAKGLKYLNLAANSDRHAQSILAQHYLSRGDFSLALSYYRKCSDANHPYCLAQLGYLHQSGQGTKIDYEMAAKLYTKALELDDASIAGINLYLLHVNNYLENASIDEGFRILEDVAKAGNPDAMQYLGDAKFYGQSNMKVNKSEAFYWYERGYQAGDAMSALDLAVEFYKDGLSDGVVVEKDLEKYFRLISFAADKGLANAQAELAIAHCRGFGTKKNFQKSKEMAIKAADQKYWNIIEQQGKRHYFGTCSAVDKSKAFVLFSIAGNYNTPNGKKYAAIAASELKETELDLAKTLLNRCLVNLTEVCF